MLGRVLLFAEAVFLVMVVFPWKLWFTRGPGRAWADLHGQPISGCSLAAVAKGEEETPHPSLQSLSYL